MSEAVQVVPPPATGRSTGLTRWGVPFAMIWAEILMSAWVYGRIGQPVTSLRVASVLLGGPVISLVMFVAFQLGLRRKPLSSTWIEDLMVGWAFMAFLVVHAVLLALGGSLIRTAGQAIPGAVCLLLLLLALLLAGLPPRSAFGIRTPLTLADERAWRRAHRYAGWAFAGAGVLSLVSWAAHGAVQLVVAISPAVVALAVSILTAYRPSGDPGDGAPRGTGDAGESASPPPGAP